MSVIIKNETSKAHDKEIKEMTEECPIKHIAFIMDGNGRWAKKRGMPREYGHKVGARVFEEVVDRCGKLGISAVTCYVFSTENWKRSEKEVKAIIKLLDEYLDKCLQQIEKKGNRVRYIFLGDMSPFSDKLRAKIAHIEKVTEGNEMIVNLAINYGGRSEMVYAYNKLIAEGVQSVSESDISRALYTKDSPELDMIVRTGGDMRLSNFLLWQAAYAELYFTDKLWPDLTGEDVDEALEVFKKRQRRFGGV